MKAITKTITIVKGDEITITGKLVDIAFPQVVAQRHNTMLHPINGHPSKPRHLQSNTHGFIVTRKGSDGILFPKDEMVAVALEIDHKLSDVPVFMVHPTKDNLIGQIASEIQLEAKIQQSDDGKIWSDAPDNVKPEHGKHYRCVATNKNGSVTSNPIHIPIPKK